MKKLQCYQHNPVVWMTLLYEGSNLVSMRCVIQIHFIYKALFFLKIRRFPKVLYKAKTNQRIKIKT